MNTPESVAVQTLVFVPLMTMFRATGLCMSAPLLGLKGVPASIRLVLSMCLTTWLCSAAPAAAAAPRMDVWWLTGLVELGAGLLAGWSARLALEASVAAGHAAASATGLSFGSTVDPQHGAESTALATLFSTVALGMTLALGLHHNLVAWLWHSTLRHPPGTLRSLSDAAQHALTTALISIPLGVQLAAPAMVASTGAQLLLGVASRSAAQLNLSTLGMMASVVGGGAALMSTAGWVLQRAALHASDVTLGLPL